MEIVADCAFPSPKPLRVPPAHQHRVLFWGIIGALIMRGIMIWMGVAMITRFHWMLYLFGAFLIFTGINSG